MKFDTKHYMSAGFLPKDMETLQSQDVKRLRHT